MKHRWRVMLAASAAALGLLAPLVDGAVRAAARTTTRCGVTGIRLLASSGPLAVVEATRTDPVAGRTMDVEACIGSHRPYQLFVLTTTDGSCYPRTARATSHRYAGIDVRCNLASVGVVADTTFSFDVLRGHPLYGSPEAAVEDVRAGFVMAANGAIADIEDGGGHTQVIGCDAHADCESGPVIKDRVLDTARHARDIGDLRIRGNTVSWRHGSKRRRARLYGRR
jgi:hypothetical protein